MKTNSSYTVKSASRVAAPVSRVAICFSGIYR